MTKSSKHPLGGNAYLSLDDSDEPYRGGWTTSTYGAPKRGQHAIQIELNRALYVDEQTSEIKKTDFAQLQTVLDQLVAKLGNLVTGSAQFATG